VSHEARAAEPSVPARAAGRGAKILPWTPPPSLYDGAFRRALANALAAAPAVAAERAEARRRARRLLALPPAQRRLLADNRRGDARLAAGLVEEAESRLGAGDADQALAAARLASLVLRRLPAVERAAPRTEDLAAAAWRLRAAALVARGDLVRAAAALERCRRRLGRGTGDRAERVAAAEARVWWLSAVGRGREAVRLARVVREVRRAAGEGGGGGGGGGGWW
jgi:hypothetical protein